MFWAFENSNFGFFTIYSVKLYKPKWKKKALRTVYIKNCPREHFKKCYLKAKHECSDLLKVVFLFFHKFLSDKVEIIFWKINAKALRLFRSEICHWEYFKKNIFQATLRRETHVLRTLKLNLWLFRKFLNDEIEAIFWESETKLLKVYISNRFC